jgi:hypothetical protein
MPFGSRLAQMGRNVTLNITTVWRRSMWILTRTTVWRRVQSLGCCMLRNRVRRPVHATRAFVMEGSVLARMKVQHAVILASAM